MRHPSSTERPTANSRAGNKAKCRDTGASPSHVGQEAATGGYRDSEDRQHAEEVVVKEVQVEDEAIDEAIEGEEKARKMRIIGSKH